MVRVNSQFLQIRIDRAKDYPKAKWIEFCEEMLSRGYTVELREARESVSKYITVWNLGKSFCVRFSNHGAHKIPNDSCDFFVGRNPGIGPSPLAKRKQKCD